MDPFVRLRFLRDKSTIKPAHNQLATDKKSPASITGAGDFIAFSGFAGMGKRREKRSDEGKNVFGRNKNRRNESKGQEG